MSLLSVTVKKARYVGIQATQFNSYVTLKLQNVKSTTVTVKGPTPSWEQDFLFEINDINLGLLVEVWNKGVIWDRALGYHYLPLTSVAYNEQECGGRWIELEAQLMMRGGAVVGTTGPTGHALLLDCRFEPPFDAEGTAGADLQRKLDLLNGALDAERAEQARRQMQYIAHSGYSEDSDYTSDLNYPVGQHANCSASQFRSAAHMHTPQRSLEVSRENSYERDEYHIHGDTDPLYYNSQPRTNSIDTWSQLHAQQSIESAISWRTAHDWQSTEEQRRPSLERQTTLYDENIGYSFDAYTASTHIRDHTHISHQLSYEEYFDSSSYPYQTSYVGDDSRQWDSGGRYFYDDGYGLTPTEYENMVNKRRSSVVQLPQLPSSKQLPPSSRYSDCNEMAPYRPRQRRTAASLPATPSSTPKRGRALPVPPGSESGSIRGVRGRRLPRLPYVAPASTTHTNVPYLLDSQKPTVPEVSYGYDSFGYQSDYQTTATDKFQDTNFNTSTYDEDGMQPFFDETPHATPPAAAQKPPWSDSEMQFSYGVQDSSTTKTANTTVVSYLNRPIVSAQEDSYQQDTYKQTSYEEDISFQQDSGYQQDSSYQQDSYQQETYQQGTYHQDTQDTGYSQSYEQTDDQYQYTFDKHEFDQQQNKFEDSYDYQFQQDGQYQPQEQHQQYQQDQQYHQQQELQLQQQQLQLQQQQQTQQQQQSQLQQQKYQLQQQKQQQQQKPQAQAQQTAQQLQTTMMTGAATLGSLMAGGAKKLGSFFGAAAAAVSAPVVSQPHTQAPAAIAPVSQYTTAIAPVTPFNSTITVPVASVPEVSSSVPLSAVTTSAPVSLPRTPSLKRQESIQRPSVRRTRTLPDAPEDMPPSSYESAYEDDYHKTDSDQFVDRDRISLDRYRDDEYFHDTIPEEPTEEGHLQEQTSPGLQKTSPTRTIIQARKPSVDSYHSQNSQAPSIINRKPSQSSFHLEEPHIVPTTQEETIADKNKVSFQVERTKYHEVPEEDTFQDEDQPYDETGTDYQDDQHYAQNEQDKFETDDQFQETDEQYQETYNESEERQEEEPLDFQPQQPKLTPRQRWHRAYNKIVMQLNVSLFSITVVKAE